MVGLDRIMNKISSLVSVIEVKNASMIRTWFDNSVTRQHTHTTHNKQETRRLNAHIDLKIEIFAAIFFGHVLVVVAVVVVALGFNPILLVFFASLLYFIHCFYHPMADVTSFVFVLLFTILFVVYYRLNS